MLILQALLPFLLFASDTDGNPIHLTINAGTHTSLSPTFDYVDQVLLPTLEQRWGVYVERALSKRGWTIGPEMRGLVSFTIHPVRMGQQLALKEPVDRFQKPEDYVLARIEVTVVAPEAMLQNFEETLRTDLSVMFPDVEMTTKTLDDSGHDSRVYVLAVAVAKSGLRWGSDLLYAIPKKPKNGKQKKNVTPWEDVSRKVSKGLHEEVNNLSQCDSHCQDQLIIFQAISKGVSSIPRRDHPVREVDDLFRGLDLAEPSRMRKEKTVEPFGEGTLHATTARYVASQLVPSVNWFAKGQAVEGSGLTFRGEDATESKN